MMPYSGVLVTPRMTLETFSAEAIAAMRDGDAAAFERLMNVRISEWYFQPASPWMDARIKMIHDDPGAPAWLMYAMVLHDRTLVGDCGYHAPPSPEGMVEIGYQVSPSFRRRGYAIEAVRALIDNAFAHPEVKVVRASISPANDASLSLTEKLGFVRIGEQMDEIDGLEYVFELSRHARSQT